ncbi:hypothetical protein BDW74DRAFT_172298 [Aspergillus multicolor]|uniref:flavin monoamine oxidase family protein n=1 Tax=Aspergillus multicolor TaxID=41759 RepID=UPI003CCD2D3D
MPRSTEGFQWTPTSTTVGLETASVVPSTPEPAIRPFYDAIVIGTGYAGLIAARDISIAHGPNVLLLDARDRIGGRTWTAAALGENFEMGGTWIHWNQPHVFAQLQRYNLHKTIKTSNGTLAPEKAFWKFATGVVKELNVQDLNASLERIGNAFFSPDGYTSRDLMPYPHDPFRDPALWTRYDDLSIKDRLDQISAVGTEEDKAYFETMMNTIGSAPGTDISFTEPLRWYALGGHTVAGMFEIIETFKLGGGGQTALARGILGEYRGHLRLNTVVERVEQGKKGVEVTAKDGKVFKAKWVVCTIPLNVLSDIAFSPPFSPLRQEAIVRGHMNRGAKFHFKLDAPLKPWLAIADAYGSSPFVLSFSDHNGTGENSGSGNYAIGFGYNGHLGTREDAEHVVSAFKNMRPATGNGPGADVDVAAYLTHDWVNDPFSKGAWSTWGPGDMTKYLAELQKDHGRVLMASADWAEGWRGFIDGAIERGVVAAKEVVARLAGEGEGAKL